MRLIGLLSFIYAAGLSYLVFKADFTGVQMCIRDSIRQEVLRQVKEVSPWKFGNP